MTQCPDENIDHEASPLSAPTCKHDRDAKATHRSGQKTLLLSALLFVLIFGLFLPSLKNEFISCDDNDYVTANQQVQRGLAWENFYWAFADVHVGFYHPLTLLSHMLDCQLFGLKPWGHHLTSVLIHVVNALLIFLIFKEITSALWCSFFVAMFFGIHPLHVESVAWIADRKDLLSTLFGLWTIWFYAQYAKAKESGANSRSNSNYVLALVCFTASLLSKSMLVTLPFVLLLLDFWPLHRMSATTRGRLILEKIPFLLLAAVASVLAIFAEKKWDALATTAAMPLHVRIDNALVSYCRYIGKLLVPTKLAMLYPHPGGWPTWQVLFAGLILIFLTSVAIARLRQRPYFAVGWFWFVGTLVPVIGLVQVGGHAMADRYTYVPLIGLFILLVWSARDMAKNWRYERIALGAVSILVFLPCAVITRQQLSYWNNSETLFRHAIAVTKDNIVMHNNLAAVLSKAPGRVQESIAQLEEVLFIDPNDATIHNRLGTALAEAGELDKAISHYETALRLKPDYAAAHNHLGIALAQTGRLQESIAHFVQALRFDPYDASAHFNLGITLAKASRESEAGPQYEAALRLDPNFTAARQALERLRTDGAKR